MTIKPIPRWLRPFFRFHHGHDSKWCWRFRPDISLMHFLYHCGFIRAAEGERLQWRRLTFEITKVHGERYLEAHEHGHRMGVKEGHDQLLEAQLAEIRRRAAARESNPE